MESFDERKLELLEKIGKLIKVIDFEIDWYICSFKEKDPKRRALARSFFYEKQKERVQLAKEAYERSK